MGGGVDDGTRTRDNRNHNPGLYQLSYNHHIITNLPEAKSFNNRARENRGGILVSPVFSGTVIQRNFQAKSGSRTKNHTSAFANAKSSFIKSELVGINREI